MQDRVTCLPGWLSPNFGLKSVAIEKIQWGVNYIDGSLAVTMDYHCQCHVIVSIIFVVILKLPSFVILYFTLSTHCDSVISFTFPR